MRSGVVSHAATSD